MVLQSLALLAVSCGDITTTGWRTYCAVDDPEPCCIAWNSNVRAAVCNIHYEAQTPVTIGDCPFYLNGGIIAGSSFRKISDLDEWLFEFRPPKQMIGWVLYVQMVALNASSNLVKIPVLARMPLTHPK